MNPTTSAPEVFDFRGHDVRVITADDGEPRFVLNDLCAAMGLTNPRMVRDRLSVDCVSQADVADARGQVRPTNVVDESGMYEVILRSDRPEAVEFRRWVTREVLPSIRKRGGYLTPDAAEQALTDPDFIIRLATDLKNERARRVEAEDHARQLEPRARSWTTMAAAGGDWSVAEAAKVLSRDPAISIGRDRLFRVMHEHGWIFRTRGRRPHWEARQDKALDTGRLAHKLSRPFLNERTGEMEQPPPTVRVTPKGLHELHRMLGGTHTLQAVAS